MNETRVAVEAPTMPHPITRHTLDKRRAKMKCHRPNDPQGSYWGEIFSGTYFWCNRCGKAFMSTEQFDEAYREEARQYTFVLALSNIPIQPVPWIKG